MRVTPTVKANCTVNATGIQTLVPLGANSMTAKSARRATHDTTMSIPAIRTLASGKTSRGQYTLFNSTAFDTTLCPPTDTDVEKNAQGISPRNAKSGYGAPCVSKWAVRCRNTENATISTSGVSTAQAMPSTACW